MADGRVCSAPREEGAAAGRARQAGHQSQGLLRAQRQVPQRRPGQGGGAAAAVPGGASRSRYFVTEVFSGCEAFLRAARSAGPGSLAFDVLQGPGGDLARRAVQRRARRLLRNPRCIGIIFAPPCTTYSTARRPMIRSRTRAEGLSNLASREVGQLRLGTLLLRATASLIKYASECGAPWVVENPQSSLMWHAPEFSEVFQLCNPAPVTTHMCGFGARWKNLRRSGHAD